MSKSLLAPATIGAALLFISPVGAPSEAQERGWQKRQRITIIGTVTNEGVECTAVRATNGRLYTLAGRPAGLRSGDRVQVKGTRAEASFCMQGITIDPQRIRRF